MTLNNFCNHQDGDTPHDLTSNRASVNPEPGDGECRLTMSTDSIQINTGSIAREEVSRGVVSMEEFTARNQGLTGQEGPGLDPEAAVPIEEPRAQEGDVEQLSGSPESPKSVNPGSGEHCPPTLTVNIQGNCGSAEIENPFIVIASHDEIIQDQVGVSCD